MLAVLKYGGNALPPQGADPIFADLAALAGEGWQFVIVHGGGPEIDAALAQGQIQTERIAGLRITDERTLEVTERVLCGTINKRLVRQCRRLGIAAAGISGQDGATLIARKMTSITNQDLGYVGEITEVDPGLVRVLLDGGYTPILAPLAIAADGECAYNVNADTAGGALAAALCADLYIVVSNVPYVLRDAADPASRIEQMSLEEACRFSESPACMAGMKPKMLSVIHALQAGVQKAIVCSTGPQALRRAIAGAGTIFRP